MTTAESLRILGHALDQAGDVLDHVRADRLPLPTPCTDWDVAALADHLVEAPRRFLQMMRGQQPDWAAPPPHVEDGWGPRFREAGDDLIHAWHQRGEDVAPPPQMQIAEIATHTWDLATALGRPISTLDPEVAETGLAFLQQMLKPDLRGSAFAPEQVLPDGAGPYDRLAAFAGRTVVLGQE